MLRILPIMAVLLLVPLQTETRAASAEVAEADAARKKPLRRCDELKGEAELECLNKARERIVEARKKRESAPQQKEAAKK